MIGRRFLLSIAAAAALTGSTRAEGTDLLDMLSEQDQSGVREMMEATRSEIELTRVPPAVTRAALEVVPGMKVEAAAVLRHRPLAMLRYRQVKEYLVKGRDADGRAVGVRTRANGGPATVTRVVPITSLPDTEIAQGRQSAAKHGYTLTSALLVTRVDRSMFRKPVQTECYYLRGSSASQPGVERLVWLCELGNPRLKDFDDVSLKLIGLDFK
jgi:hypothetical protein